MAKAVSIHIFDALHPDDDQLVDIYTDVIPSIGDHVLYWVDYPYHKNDVHKCRPGEPSKITGIVSKVEIEYRNMRYSEPYKTYVLVSVYLSNCQTTIPVPEEKA